MDGKRDLDCRRAADVLFAARYDLSPCAAIHAAPLVWMADRRSIGSHYLRFHTDSGFAFRSVQLFSSDHAERQRVFTHWHLSVAKRCLILRGALGFETENDIEGRP